MIQNGSDLFHAHAWKPFDKLIDATAVFQVLEKSRNRDTGATKTQVPLTRSGSRSTAEQVDQSNMMLS
jgi:hypothetical protein